MIPLQDAPPAQDRRVHYRKYLFQTQEARQHACATVELKSFVGISRISAAPSTRAYDIDENHTAS